MDSSWKLLRSLYLHKLNCKLLQAQRNSPKDIPVSSHPSAINLFFFSSHSNIHLQSTTDCSFFPSFTFIPFAGRFFVFLHSSYFFPLHSWPLLFNAQARAHHVHACILVSLVSRCSGNARALNAWVRGRLVYLSDVADPHRLSYARLHVHTLLYTSPMFTSFVEFSHPGCRCGRPGALPTASYLDGGALVNWYLYVYYLYACLCVYSYL